MGTCKLTLFSVLFEGKCFKVFCEFFYGVFKVGLNTQQNSPAAHCSAIQNSIMKLKPGRVAQSVGHLTRKSGVLGSIPGLATYFRFSFRFFKKGSCQLLAKVCARSTVHKVLVNRLGGLSLPRKSVVRLTDLYFQGQSFTRIQTVGKHSNLYTTQMYYQVRETCKKIY